MKLENVYKGKRTSKQWRRDQWDEFIKDSWRKKGLKILGLLFTAGAVVSAGYFGGTALYNKLKGAEKSLETKTKQYDKIKLSKKKQEEKFDLTKKELDRIRREKTALEATYKKEKAEMIKQYLGSELKGEYDSKIGYNTFDLVLMPSDENYSYFKLEVKKTDKLQLNPENKALGAAVEDYFNRLVDLGIITKKVKKNILENGGIGEYEFADGEALLKIKQKGLGYQDYLTPDKRDSLEKKIFGE